jgi:hypothetical protein
MKVFKKEGIFMKKGQTALISFLVLIVLLIVIISLFSSQFFALLTGDDTYEEVKADSEHVSQQLMSEGYPVDWNTENVKKVGLLEQDKITINRLMEFANVEYPKSKKLLGIKYDYMFFIEDLETGDRIRLNYPISRDYPISREFFGWNGNLQSYGGNGGLDFDYFFGLVEANAKHIVKKERFVYIIGETEEGATVQEAKLVIYVWDFVDAEVGVHDCNDGKDNDDDYTCDFLTGCVCSEENSYCGTGEETISYLAPDPGCSWYDDDEEGQLEFKCRITDDTCDY